MKYRNLLLAAGLSLLVFLPGCSLIAGIFKAGFWTAIIIVVIIVALIVFAIKKLGGR